MFDLGHVGSIWAHSIDELQVQIPSELFGFLETDDEYIHQIEGEFLFCNHLFDAKLILTEKQLNDILSIERMTIHTIHGGVIYIKSFSLEARIQLFKMYPLAKLFSIENIEDEDDDVVLLLQLI